MVLCTRHGLVWMCASVFECLCECECGCGCVLVCKCRCVCSRLCMRVCSRLCMCVCTRACACVCVCLMLVHVCVRVCLVLVHVCVCLMLVLAVALARAQASHQISAPKALWQWPRAACASWQWRTLARRSTSRWAANTGWRWEALREKSMHGRVWRGRGGAVCGRKHWQTLNQQGKMHAWWW